MPNKNQSQHIYWMKQALQMAERGRFTTSPNPMVGCCVVKGKRLISSGYHAAFGGDHAEIMALKKSGRRSKGATLYVTLEPCGTWGKTPPCAGGIIRAGVREVIIGALDPNPKNHGKGVQALRKAGIRVRSGILAQQVIKQNEAFFKYVKTKRPFVILKMAQTLDGKIATKSGKSRWISGKIARHFVHELRAEQDAILVGKNTLLIDNPRLKPGNNGFQHHLGKPWRIIFEAPKKNLNKLRAFEGDQLTFVIVPEQKIPAAKKDRGIFLPVHFQKGKANLKDLLEKLGELGVAKLLVEGGGELAWSFIHQGLVDKGYWIVAPKFFGGKDAKTSVEGDGVNHPDLAVNSRIQSITPLGEDWLLELLFEKSKA